MARQYEKPLVDPVCTLKDMDGYAAQNAGEFIFFDDNNKAYDLITLHIADGDMLINAGEWQGPTDPSAPKFFAPAPFDPNTPVYPSWSVVRIR